MGANNLWAVYDGQVITISRDAVAALIGKVDGYRVKLHALPGYIFNVEAGNGDQAIARAMQVCAKEGRKLSSNAATFCKVTP